MTVLLSAVLVLAAVLLFRPPGSAAGRFRRAMGRLRVGRQTVGSPAEGSPGVGHFLQGFGLGRSKPGLASLGGTGLVRRSGQQQAGLSLTLVVQQLAALLKGGRTPARLWDELWLVHTGRSEISPGGHEPVGRQAGRTAGPGHQSGPSRRPGGSLSAGSLVMLSAVRAAAFRGSPVSEAIGNSVQAAFPRSGNREYRIWCELAACFDIAEASGCPLADVLARFAAQLEVEDDAEAARQTALAGPKATVSLLTWLPLMGLGLGMALGVDPLAILIGTPLGMAALAAGIALTVAGRLWSARLVQNAAGAGAT